MNILFYLLRGIGGGARNIRFLLKTYASTFPEDQIHVVTAFEKDFDELAPLSNVRIHVVPVAKHLELTRYHMGHAGMRNRIREIRPDVIWCINSGIYFRPTVPMVLMMNNLYLVKPWSESLEHQTHHWLRLWLIRLFFRKTLRNASRAIVQTEMVKDDIARLWPHPDAIDVVPKSIDNLDHVSFSSLLSEQDDLMSSGSGGDTFTFLFVSNHYPHKNHRILVAALDALRKRGEKIRIALTVSREDLERIGGKTALELADEGFILPFGWVEKEQMKALYDRCDACVMPSVFECLSSAHLEAMAWKKAQICVDLPYAHAVCKEAALYVDPHDADAWADAMLRLRDDEELRSALSRKGRDVIENDFPKTWSDMARRVRTSFENAIKNHENRR